MEPAGRPAPGAVPLPDLGMEPGLVEPFRRGTRAADPRVPAGRPADRHRALLPAPPGTRGLGLSMLLPLGWEGNGLANGLTEQWELLFPAEHRTALLETLGGWLQVHPWSTVLI